MKEIQTVIQPTHAITVNIIDVPNTPVEISHYKKFNIHTDPTRTNIYSVAYES